MDANHPAFVAFIGAVQATVAPKSAQAGPLARSCDTRAFAKGADLLRAGDVAEHLFFVHRGLLRYYFLDPASGEERTGQFFDEGRMFTDVASFVTGAPATQSVQALSRVRSGGGAPRGDATPPTTSDHAVERSGRLMIEEALVGAQRRAARLLTDDARGERYRALRGGAPGGGATRSAVSDRELPRDHSRGAVAHPRPAARRRTP